jgi:hypothetical protein
MQRVRGLGDFLPHRPYSLADCVLVVRSNRMHGANSFTSTTKEFLDLGAAMRAARREASKGADVEIDRACFGVPLEELVKCRGKRPGKALKCVSTFQRSRRELCPDCY